MSKPTKDEPTFTLRARDVLAPDLIDHWADRAHRAGTPDVKVAGAVTIADAMRAWQRAHGAKVPD